MTCPVCGSETTVADSRTDGEIVIRRRWCIICNHKFYTTELELPDSYTEYRRIVNAVLRRRWRENKEKKAKEAKQ